MYTLYHFGDFDRGSRIIMALEEIQASYEVVRLVPFSEEAKKTLQDLNPFGTVPVLLHQESGKACFDSSAALRLLGANSSLGYRQEEDGFVLSESFLGFLSTSGDSAVTKFFTAYVRQDSTAIEHARPDMQRWMSVMDAQLADGRDTLAGARFTYADIILLDLAARINIWETLAAFPNLSAYVEKHKDRPSVKASKLFDPDTMNIFLTQVAPFLRQAFSAG